MKQQIILIAVTLLISAGVRVSAQDTLKVGAVEQGLEKKAEPRTKRFKTVYWGLRAGGGQLLWDNDLDGYQTEAAMAFQGGFFIEVRPIKYIAIETGASYVQFKSKGTLESYGQVIDGVDSEGDKVEYHLQVTSLEEEQMLTWVEVPIALKLNAFAGNWEFYAKGGMVYRYGLKSEYTQAGRFSNHGYYKQWDLYVDDMPSQGFYTEYTEREKGEMTWVNALDPFVSAGIVFPGKGTSFFIEGTYYPGNTDIMDNKQSHPFEGRMQNMAVNLQTSGSVYEMGKSTLGGFMVNIGLRF